MFFSRAAKTRWLRHLMNFDGRSITDEAASGTNARVPEGC